MKNMNYVEYEMADGTVVKLAYTMGGLFKLRNKDEGIYKLVNAVILAKATDIDILGIAQLVYGAYICTNDSDCTFEEFTEIMNPSMEVNSQAVLDLRGAGKKQDSAKPS